MKYYITLVLPMVLLVALSGCSALSSSGPKFAMNAQPFADSSKSIVYVYRLTNGRWVGRVDMTVDGKKFVEIGDSEYSWCRVSPGDHIFRAEWGLMDKPMFEEGHFDAKTLNVKIESNKIYFLCYSIRENSNPTTMLESSGLLGKALSKSHVTSVEFLSEEEALGLHNIRTCGYRESSMTK